MCGTKPARGDKVSDNNSCGDYTSRKILNWNNALRVTRLLIGQRKGLLIDDESVSNSANIHNENTALS